MSGNEEQRVTRDAKTIEQLLVSADTTVTCRSGEALARIRELA